MSEIERRLPKNLGQPLFEGSYGRVTLLHLPVSSFLFYPQLVLHLLLFQPLRFNPQLPCQGKDKLPGDPS